MYYYVYILISEIRKNWSYVGQTDNLERRINEHNKGKVKSTKGMCPLKIVHTESYLSRDKSLMRENYLKSGSGREEKKKILSNYSGVV